MENHSLDDNLLNGKKLLLITLVGEYTLATINEVKQAIIDRQWCISWIDDLGPGVFLIEVDELDENDVKRPFDLKQEFMALFTKLPLTTGLIMQDVSKINDATFSLNISAGSCMRESIDILKEYKTVNAEIKEGEDVVYINDVQTIDQWKKLDLSTRRQLTDIALENYAVNKSDSTRILKFATAF